MGRDGRAVAGGEGLAQGRRHHQRQADLLRRWQPADAVPDPAGERGRGLRASIEEVKRQLRVLETLGVPVVAAINGAALGGGLEIALACHHRIVADDNRIEIGVPEVTLGLLPGGGGVTRTVRMLGLQDALDEGAAAGPADEARARASRSASSTRSSRPTSCSTRRTAGSTRTTVTPSSPGIATATRSPAVRRPRRSWPRSSRPSRRTCASSSRARRTRHRGRS